VTVTTLAGRTLAISTASPALSLALFDGDTLSAHDHRIIGRGHAEALMPAIAALMGTTRVDAILVDTGPGSFTGIRIGIAAARALGVAWRVPVNGFSGTSLVAAAAFAAAPALASVTAVIDAGRGQSFCQRISAAFDAGDVETVATETLGADDAVLAGDVPVSRAAAWRGMPDCAFALALPIAARSGDAAAHYVRPPDAILPL
jgi:tRNA threonylcarbamoyl adenosine modification protein YeaZ